MLPPNGRPHKWDATVIAKICSLQTIGASVHTDTDGNNNDDDDYL